MKIEIERSVVEKAHQALSLLALKFMSSVDEKSWAASTSAINALAEALAAPNSVEFDGIKTVAHWTALTDQDREAVFNSLPDALDGFLKKWGWLHFAKAIEDACRVKNSGASKQWEPEFDAICPKQEALAKQFCEDIAQTHGGLMDPVRLLEMAEALYCAERDESIDPGSSDVVESVARNINAGHDGKYCSDLWPVTADAIRNFVGSDFCSLKFGREDQAPDESDQYLMSAHDLISAFRSWKDFELQLVTQQAPDALHLAAIDLARKQADRIAELEAEVTRFRADAMNEKAARQALERQIAARVPLTDQRAAFERAMAAEGYELNPSRYRDGSYRAQHYSAAWAMWQRARAALVPPLTDEQIEREWQFLHDEEGYLPDHHDFARAIEAAHGITKGGK